MEITVLMTVYNGSKYLLESINSIINQTINNYEILVIDDGSVDNSSEILNKINNTKLRIIKNDINMGQTRSLNKGLGLAKGRYIARMDQDDISFENRLELQYNFLENNNHISLVGSGFQTIQDGESSPLHYIPPTRDKNIKNTIIYKSPFAHSSIFFRKKDILSVGGYPNDFKYIQDLALYSKLINNNYKLENIPKELIMLRKHRDQTYNIAVSFGYIYDERIKLFELLKTFEKFANQKQKINRQISKIKFEKEFYNKINNDNKILITIIKTIINNPLNTFVVFNLLFKNSNLKSFIVKIIHGELNILFNKWKWHKK